jgi:hypothetical protein
LIARTNAARVDGFADKPLPRSFGEVADVVQKNRADLEAGGVFPPRMLDAVAATLRKHA